ncbi:MAG TPA: Uma2 family endonuclease [Pilimelia sp.]|nr:Uma2 family endonuclease [Pilimelia sp.]
MTVANPLDPPTVLGRPWMIDDLHALPDRGYRYEIFDGSLLVTPPPALPHASVLYRLRRLLERQAPAALAFVESIGVYPNDTNYYIPDMVLIPLPVLDGEGQGVSPDDVLLAIEVVSPSNPGNDHVLKRHAYAVAGIREYWIVDERDHTLRVLTPGEHGGGYVERAVIRPGETWRSEEPFPLEVDPGELF